MLHGVEERICWDVRSNYICVALIDRPYFIVFTKCWNWRESQLVFLLHDWSFCYLPSLSNHSPLSTLHSLTSSNLIYDLIYLWASYHPYTFLFKLTITKINKVDYFYSCKSHNLTFTKIEYVLSLKPIRFL